MIFDNKCNQLKSVVFQPDSELIEIGISSFRESAIESITIPSHVKIINCYAFNKCKQLKKVEFAQNSELVSINGYAFIESSISEINIPPNAKIAKTAFKNCLNFNT